MEQCCGQYDDRNEGSQILTPPIFGVCYIGAISLRPNESFIAQGAEGSGGFKGGPPKNSERYHFVIFD